jgi:hypothetical protein
VQQRRGDIEGAGSHAPAAVEHAGNHEEASEIPSGTTHTRDHLVIILHRHARIELRIGPAEINDEFAAALAKCREIGSMSKLAIACSGSVPGIAM